jgi:predicted RNA-binding protein associated with RNAse of E/G family
MGGWVTPAENTGISLFHPERAFVVSCHGPLELKRFYVDMVRSSTIADGLIEYLDLYLDVMIDPAGRVTEKDEEHLHRLEPAEQLAVRRARDDVRGRIAAGDPLFDAASEYFALPAGARSLEPLPDQPS